MKTRKIEFSKINKNKPARIIGYKFKHYKKC